ncbi:MAG: AMP-binding protein [Hyphomicrobiales bacterium]
MDPFPTPGAAIVRNAREWGAGDALAFPESGERASYLELYDRSRTLARALLALGLGKGSHIGIIAENRIEWPIVQVAVALIGGVLVPLNTHLRQEDLQYALSQSGVRALFASERFRSNLFLEMIRALRPALPDLQHVLVMGRPGTDELSFEEVIAAGRASSADLPEVHADDVAALLYTSGTTGSPKGALLTHRGMMQNSWETAARLGITRSDRWTSIIPLFHCAGCIMNLLGCLETGACYVGVSAFDPELMFRVIEKERCTVLSGVPTSYLAMLQHPTRHSYDLTSLRTGTCGGADCSPELLRRCAAEFPQPQLCQVYGQTEASTLIACPASDDPERFETAGLPLPGFDLRITDPVSGTVRHPGEIGHIKVQGPMVMKGYFGSPKRPPRPSTKAGSRPAISASSLHQDGSSSQAAGSAT